ncbi:MAG: amino acid permease [Firmicutes bacterium]|nr:amino acid permease [Bacillota bacterium]
MKDTAKNPQNGGESKEIIQGTLPGDAAIIRRREKTASLKRSLSFFSIFSFAYGNLSSCIYYALGVAALYALGATPLVFFIASIFFLFTAATYAEGSAAIPEAGGSSSFARKAFNEPTSFVAGWCLLLAYIVTISIAATAAIGYLSALEQFAFLKQSPWNIIAVGAILLVLMVINIVGTRFSALMSNVFIIIDILTQIFIIVMGFLFFLNLPELVGRIRLGVVPTWNQLLLGFYVVTIAFTSIETISNLAGESRDPGTTMPRTFWYTTLATMSLFVLVSAAALSSMPVEFRIEGYLYTQVGDTLRGSQTSEQIQFNYYKDKQNKPDLVPIQNAVIRVRGTENEHQDRTEIWRELTDEKGYFVVKGLDFGKYDLKIYKKGYQDLEFNFDTRHPETAPMRGLWTSDLVENWKNNPVAGIADAISGKLPLLKHPLSIWISLFAFTVLIIATNSGIVGVSRLIFSLGSHNQIPHILAKVHPKFNTPYIAIIVFTMVAFIIALPADIEKLAQVYAFAAMISYTIAHASIIAMRVKFPDMHRPFKIKLNLRIAGRDIPITAILGGLFCIAVWILVAFYKDYGRNVALLFILSGILIYHIYRKSSEGSPTDGKQNKS